MEELAKDVFTAPLGTIFVLAGVLFLLIAVVGKISGKIEPGQKERVLSHFSEIQSGEWDWELHITDAEEVIQRIYYNESDLREETAKLKRLFGPAGAFEQKPTLLNNFSVLKPQGSSAYLFLFISLRAR